MTQTKTTHFRSNKLGRDKVVALFESKGIPVEWETLKGKAYIKALKNKLLEEAQEVIIEDTKDELIEEFCDVLEVIDALLKAYDISKDDVLAKQKEKRDKLGGFFAGVFTHGFEIPENLPEHAYFFANQDKYPIVRRS